MMLSCIYTSYFFVAGGGGGVGVDALENCLRATYGRRAKANNLNDLIAYLVAPTLNDITHCHVNV